jgi:lycopene cyclase domain-containing protein
MAFFEHSFFYFLLLAISISFPLLRSFEDKISYYKKWKALFAGIFVMMAVHIPIDIVFTKNEIWAFNNDYVSGLYLFNLPIEEWLFFIVIPFCCVFIYESINHFYKLKNAGKYNYLITLFVGVVLIVLAFVFYKKTYTSTYFSLSGIILVLIFLYQPIWWKKFQLMFLVSLIPFLIVNGFLTGSYTEEAVVMYNDNQNFGIRILNIPIEDVFYCFNILVLVVAVYEYRLSKMLSVKQN